MNFFDYIACLGSVTDRINDDIDFETEAKQQKLHVMQKERGEELSNIVFQQHSC